MTIDGWVCRVCWQRNRPRDLVCWRCKSEPDVPDPDVETRRLARDAERAARAQRAEAVPDALVALPVVIFRGYAKAWQRGGIGLLGFLLLFALGGVTEVVWLAMTVGFAAGLFISGLLAGEVAEGMRNREMWAYLAGIGLSLVGAVSSVVAFSVFAPDLVSPTAVRWGSVLVFGGAGIAAAAGLVLLLRNRLPQR